MKESKSQADARFQSDRSAHQSTDDSQLLARILDTQHLARVVPRLQPELLHKIIQTCGLGDCGELVALTTPEQLTRVFDLDLWSSSRPGRDAQFDATRFGLWLEVLLDAGAETAATKLAELDVELVAAGFAQHMLVYDRGAAARYMTLEGQEMVPVHGLEQTLSFDVGGYLVVARESETPASWDTIVGVLMALEAEQPKCFEEVMSGCRALSNPLREIDGLDDLLTDGDQAMFDVASDRERRREQQGYVTPEQARAFLQMARELPRGPGAHPPANPISRAYFRVLDETAAEAGNGPASGADAPAATDAKEDVAEVNAALGEVVAILADAGIVAHQPPLLPAAHQAAPRLERIRSRMQYVAEHDADVYSVRTQELAYLTNTIMAGCSVQARPLTTQEASDAAVAVCNLGMENWPMHWVGTTLARRPSVPERNVDVPADFLVKQDLVSVFQVGWSVLHADVCMSVAAQLIEVLKQIQCSDREIQAGLETLRFELSKHWRVGKPWQAQDSMDVMISLDILAWAALLALVGELPVIHAGIAASRDPKVRTVKGSDFEFISENSQIARVREFMQSLPDVLSA